MNPVSLSGGLVLRWWNSSYELGSCKSVEGSLRCWQRRFDAAATDSIQESLKVLKFHALRPDLYADVSDPETDRCQEESLFSGVCERCQTTLPMRVMSILSKRHRLNGTVRACTE